jgi:hypothetical protein
MLLVLVPCPLLLVLCRGTVKCPGAGHKACSGFLLLAPDSLLIGLTTPG